MSHFETHYHKSMRSLEVEQFRSTCVQEVAIAGRRVPRFRVVLGLRVQFTRTGKMWFRKSILRRVPGEQSDL